uniref:Sarcospan-like n=1 Tax=Petromyzon marinus TaxID=7757 RepID=A0AAJ7U4P0_PETMA|nr:sarcospan-like [Petromyzon marinus]
MLIGTVVTAVAFSTSDLSPSLRPRDTPYWAGLPVCLAATLGFYMQSMNHHEEETARMINVRVAYFLCCTLGAALSLTAACFAAHHGALLASSICHPRTQGGSRGGGKGHSGGGSHTAQVLLNVCAAACCLGGCYLLWRRRYQGVALGRELAGYVDWSGGGRREEVAPLGAFRKYGHSD